MNPFWIAIFTRPTERVKRSILLYGLAAGAIILLMEALQFKAMIRDVSLELYGGVIAVLFAALGIGLGISFFNNSSKEHPAHGNSTLVTDPAEPAIELSPREQEVLQLLAQGHTNREIAEQLFVSTNTVKTHTSNIYHKLDVQRRTQAVQRARELHLI